MCLIEFHSIFKFENPVACKTECKKKKTNFENT